MWRGWLDVQGFAAILSLAGVVVLAAAARAEPPVDKSQFTLLNPTPRDLRRPLIADRPGFGDSPITVDAGAFQLETALVGYSRESDDGDVQKTWSFGSNTSIRVGLWDDLEFQFAFTPYQRQRDSPENSPAETNKGFSDLTLRAKYNLWGNEEGATALALFPSLTLPTDTELSTDKVSGGLSVPFEWRLDEVRAFTATVQLNAPYDGDDNDYDLEFVHTIGISSILAGKLAGYVEYLGTTGSGSVSTYRSMFNTGLTLELTRSLVLDTEGIVGIGNAAGDYEINLGLSFRY